MVFGTASSCFGVAVAMVVEDSCEEIIPTVAALLPAIGPLDIDFRSLGGFLLERRARVVMVVPVRDEDDASVPLSISLANIVTLT